MTSGANLRVLADPAELAHTATLVVLAHARAAIAARGSFHLALAGGSTPRATYAELARRGAAAGFAHWHAWFGDERCVPPEDAPSNYRLARDSRLLARLPARQIHRLRGEAPEPEHEAWRYARELVATLGSPPRLDLVLLGLGPDGHTASLFPGTPALEARGWVTVGRAPTPPVERLTLTLRTLAEARCALFLVSGLDKAPMLAQILAALPGDLPASLVHPRAGTLLWLADRSAAPADTER